MTEENVTVYHQWVYSEDKTQRICKTCHMHQLFDEDNEPKWIWLATDEFMDCNIVCEEEKEDD